MKYYDLYVKYHGLGEKRRWNLEEDVAWNEIDPTKANAELAQLLKIGALVESFSYQNCARFFRAHRAIPWLIGWKVMNLYEENKHHYSILRYAQALGIPVEEEEIVAIQHGYDHSEDLKDSQWTRADLLEELVLAWISEIETAVWYGLTSKHIGEPVGEKLFKLIAQDEHFHAAYYNEVITRMIEEDPERQMAKIMAVVKGYQEGGKDEHYGVVIGRETFARVRSTMEELGAVEQIKTLVGSKLKAWGALVPA